MKRLPYLMLCLCGFLACSEPVSTFRFSRTGLVQSQLPNFAKDGKGNLYLSEVEFRDSSNYLGFSKIQGKNLSEKQSIVSGDDWFVNWADFPSVQVFPDDQHLFLHWLEKSGEGVYDYDIRFKIYSIADKAISETYKLNDSEVKGEYGFVSSVPYKDGIQLVWLDGRNSKGHAETKEEHSHGGGVMQLRTRFLKSTGEMTASVLLDDKVCDCCQTTICADGEKLFVQYRDRSDDEYRDISLLIFDKEWSQAIPFSNDHWKIAGCPVNGPSVDTKNNLLVSAWYTASNEYPQVNLAFYDTNLRKEIKRFTISEGKTLGRVDVKILNTQEALIVYMDADEEFSDVKISRVHIDKGIVETQSIARNTNARDTGFPQIELIGNRLYYSFLDQLQTKQVELGFIDY